MSSERIRTELGGYLRGIHFFVPPDWVNYVGTTENPSSMNSMLAL